MRKALLSMMFICSRPSAEANGIERNKKNDVVQEEKKKKRLDKTFEGKERRHKRWARGQVVAQESLRGGWKIDIYPPSFYIYLFFFSSFLLDSVVFSRVGGKKKITSRERSKVHQKHKTSLFLCALWARWPLLIPIVVVFLTQSFSLLHLFSFFRESEASQHHDSNTAGGRCSVSHRPWRHVRNPRVILVGITERKREDSAVLNVFTRVCGYSRFPFFFRLLLDNNIIAPTSFPRSYSLTFLLFVMEDALNLTLFSTKNIYMKEPWYIWPSENWGTFDPGRPTFPL